MWKSEASNNGGWLAPLSQKCPGEGLFLERGFIEPGRGIVRQELCASAQGCIQPVANAQGEMEMINYPSLTLLPPLCLLPMLCSPLAGSTQRLEGMRPLW